MNDINSTISCLGIEDLSIYLLLSFLVLVPDMVILDCPLSVILFQLFSSGQLVSSCPLSDNLFLVVPFRTTILRTRFGLRCYSRRTDTDRPMSTGVRWGRDSPLLCPIPCPSVPEGISCP